MLGIINENKKRRTKSQPLSIVNLGGRLHQKCSRQGGCGLYLPYPERFDKGGTKKKGGPGGGYRTACKDCRKVLERGKADAELAKAARQREYDRAVALYGGQFFTYRITIQRKGQPTLRYEGMTGQSPIQRWGQHIFGSHLEAVSDAIAEKRLQDEFRACQAMAGSSLFGGIADQVLVHFEVSGAYWTKKEAEDAERLNIKRVAGYCALYGDELLNTVGVPDAKGVIAGYEDLPPVEEEGDLMNAMYTIRVKHP